MSEVLEPALSQDFSDAFSFPAKCSPLLGPSRTRWFEELQSIEKHRNRMPAGKSKHAVTSMNLWITAGVGKSIQERRREAKPGIVRCRARRLKKLENQLEGLPHQKRNVGRKENMEIFSGEIVLKMVETTERCVKASQPETRIFH